MSQSNQYSADQLVITKSPDTKSPISWELLNIIVCFNDHHKALFNALLLAINRSQGDKIPWRYKVLNNRTKDCPKMVRLSLFQEQ